VLSKQIQKERKLMKRPDGKVHKIIHRWNKCKSLISLILCTALIITVFSGISFAEPKIAEAEESTLSNPRIILSSSMDTGRKVTWDCIWFGSYPQAEVVPAGSEYKALPEKFLEEGDLISDDVLYQILQQATGWDGQGDIVLSGEKYRRITKENATYVTTDSKDYKWKGETEYHYFKYQPIKWRVLSVNGSEALLLSDKVLDSKHYNIKYEDITWEESTIRSWLNGYNASANIQNQDYSNNNFIDNAFGTSGQQFIKETYVENDNFEYGINGGNDTDCIDGGNDTQDKIFLLSASEISANRCGYVPEEYIECDDEAFMAGSSVYAKAMGIESYGGDCEWWLRTQDASSYGYITLMDCEGWVGSFFAPASDNGIGVRPALNLDLAALPDTEVSKLWSYAGTVCSDGTVYETGRDTQDGYNSDVCLELGNLCKVVKGQETFVWGTAYADSYDKLKEVGDSLVWISEDTSIAVVENGGYIMPFFMNGQELSMCAKVTGVTEGETNIYVEAKYGSRVRCNVIVTGSKDILFFDDSLSPTITSKPGYPYLL